MHYANAFALLSRGKFIEAERRFTIVIELEPRFARAWEGRGQARLYKGDVKEAIADFDQAIELKPDLAKAYAHRALAHFIDGHPGLAEDDADTALGLDNSNYPARIVLGRVYAERGQNDLAAAAFDTAVLLNTRSGDPYYWRARFEGGLGDYASAIADFTRAIELSPSLTRAYLDRAIARIRARGDIELARADLEEAKARAKEPPNPGVEREAQRILDLLDEAAATAVPEAGEEPIVPPPDMGTGSR